MTYYILKRLLLGLLAVLLVTFALFSIMHLMPGDPIRIIADPRMPAERIEALKIRWGLDQPFHIQYLFWLANVARGDLGTSITTRQPVSQLVFSRLPYTLGLSGVALILQYLVGIIIGLVVATRRGTLTDHALIASTIVLRSVPSFWLAILLILLFAVHLGLFPISGYGGPRSLVLPVLALLLPSLADTMRLTRSEVLDVLQKPFVTTARAKGLPEWIVQPKHVLRNALIPVTVTLFLSLPWLVGGAVVVESVFAWPGMGRLLWRSILSQDFPVVQGIVLVIAIMTVVCNTLGDIVTAWLDPRIRAEYEGP